ncbi:MAG: alpha/beta hydrolase family protein [Gammaproteobacteria bacterium]|nr:alpha/beta hydrolase family protein [Gammaproteobacteria bacterium]
MKKLTFLVLLIMSFGSIASDIAREKRLADQIVDSILDGEPIFLKSQNHEFLSIYTETEDESAKGAAIILHGRGYHPDWKDVVYPLRTELPKHGWNTLSIQMPVLDKQARFYEYRPIFKDSYPRIDAAISYLLENNIKNIILIAHSCSVHMSMDWFEQSGSSLRNEIDAYIGIGMGATDYKQYMSKPFPIDKLTIPFLDIYGSDDYPAVINMAPARKKMLEATGVKESAQVLIFDANHYFTEQGDPLVKEITDWLNKLTLQ